MLIVTVFKTEHTFGMKVQNKCPVFLFNNWTVSRSVGTRNHICSDQGSVRPLAVSNSQGVLYFFNLHRGVWRAFQLFFTSGHREFWVCVCVPLSTYQYVFLIRYLLPRQGNDYVFKLLLTYKWRK